MAIGCFPLEWAAVASLPPWGKKEAKKKKKGKILPLVIVLLVGLAIAGMA